MNTNVLHTSGFSNPESQELYEQQWPRAPAVRKMYNEGQQCGGCSFFAPFNSDWGLCCHPRSPHLTETVFEHFCCAAFVREGWGPHSFTENREFQCRCGGVAPVEPAVRKPRRSKRT